MSIGQRRDETAPVTAPCCHGRSAAAGRSSANLSSRPLAYIIDGDPQRFIVRTVNFTAYDPAHVGPRQSTLEETLARYRAYRRAAP